VEALILRLRAKTKPGRPEPDSDTEPAPMRALSDSTIRQTYTVLRAGLDGAVRDGLLARNPAAQVCRPGVGRQEAHHLDADGVTGPRNLLRVIEVAAKAAGVVGIGVHTLRHFAAVSWLEPGAHQGRRRPARAQLDLDHRRRVRAHLRRHGAGRGGRAGRTARAVTGVTGLAGNIGQRRNTVRRIGRPRGTATR
jgi:hypothetical protein